MNNFQTIAEIIAPYAPIGMIISIAGMLFFYKRLKAIRNINWLVKNQHEIADPKIFDALLDFADENGKKDRILALLIKARTQLGHQNLKNGHVTWLIFAMDDATPVENINVPTFVTEHNSGTISM